MLCLCTSIHGMQHESSESESEIEISSDECSGVEMEDVSKPVPPLIVVVPTPSAQPVTTQVGIQNVTVLPTVQPQAIQIHNPPQLLYRVKQKAVALVVKHPHTIISSCIVVILFAVGAGLLFALTPRSYCYDHSCS